MLLTLIWLGRWFSTAFWPTHHFRPTLGATWSRINLNLFSDEDDWEASRLGYLPTPFAPCRSGLLQQVYQDHESFSYHQSGSALKSDLTGMSTRFTRIVLIRKLSDGGLCSKHHRTSGIKWVQLGFPWRQNQSILQDAYIPELNLLGFFIELCNANTCVSQHITQQFYHNYNCPRKPQTVN